MYGENRFGRHGAPPVREGEELDVTIEAVGEKGDGIARKDGFVLFVPETRRGDEVRIRVTKVLSKVGFAEKLGAVEKKAPAEKPAKPEFDPEPELDSEDFGEEPAARSAPDAPASDESSPEAGSGSEGEAPAPSPSEGAVEEGGEASEELEKQE